MRQTVILTILVFVLAVQFSWSQIPQTMSYQGVLTDTGGAPVADGNYDLTFSIYDVATGGATLWTEAQSVVVVNGTFSVILGSLSPLTPDFDQQYWLGVTVGAGDELAPRIQLTSAAYSLNAQSVADDAVTGDAIADGHVVRSINGKTDDVTLAEGTNVTITPTGNTLTISAAFDGWSLTGNSGTTAGTNFLGTTDNEPLELRVNSTRILRLEPHPTSPNIIGGYSDNSVTSGVCGATIGGGGLAGSTNRVTDVYGTVGGGGNNQAGDAAGTTEDATYATVGGGSDNTASAEGATVGGGGYNTASGMIATVGGGGYNTASKDFATVGGGFGNTASAGYATISGGGMSNILDPATGNRVTDDYGTVGGGGNNQAGDNAGTTEDATYATVGGGFGNTASKDFATVGGGFGNTASAGYATISGGGSNNPGNPATGNRVTDDYGTVGGGGDNQAGDAAGTTEDATFATVGGGAANTASGACDTVGGGGFNSASGGCATVGGGFENTASGGYATVGGGWSNSASGGSATVPGGCNNTAAGDYSFAAGRRAKANHNGSFVWGDSTNANVVSTGVNQFIVRANGGAWLHGPGLTVSDTGDAVLVLEADTDNANEDDNPGILFSQDGGAVKGFIGFAEGTNMFSLGNQYNDAVELHVNNARALRLEPNASGPNIIGGDSSNSVAPGAYGATIGGGANGNLVTDDYGTVGGGGDNQAGDNAGITADATFATVGGGDQNIASGQFATVGGGHGNTASGSSTTVGGGYLNIASGSKATVGGGQSNSASGDMATVSGGYTNTASGNNATVGGGEHNDADGNVSFVAGRRAKCNVSHHGTFMFSDAQYYDFNSAAANEFAVRCAGGARFVTAIDGSSVPTAGVQVAGGGGSWSSISDRNLKENFTLMDCREVLKRLASIPVESWNYKSQDASIRHMGPMAQDFYTAFGLGEDDKHITTVDADGVALAAIQGLYELVKEKDAEIAELRAEKAALKASVDDLKARMKALEAMVR